MKNQSRKFSFFFFRSLKMMEAAISSSFIPTLLLEFDLLWYLVREFPDNLLFFRNFMPTAFFPLSCSLSENLFLRNSLPNRVLDLGFVYSFYTRFMFSSSSMLVKRRLIFCRRPVVKPKSYYLLYSLESIEIDDGL